MSRRPTALVTGASSGLGAGIALALGRAGYDLALTEIEADRLATLSRHPDLAGGKVVAVPLDLRSQASIEQAFARAREGLGEIDLLVNNAGRAIMRPAVDFTPDEWDEMITVNLKGAFFLSQLFGRACIAKQRAGSIVNVASTHGLTGIATRSIYGISKAGLIQMTRMLAIEWAAANIRVNAIAPTMVLTADRQKQAEDPEVRRGMLSRIPTGRFVTLEEIGAAVVYLASPAAAPVTGHTLLLDGGLTSA